jgi:hypothetical protein
MAGRTDRSGAGVADLIFPIDFPIHNWNLSLGPEYRAQTRWISSFALRSAPAEWKSKQVRQKLEQATSAILMSAPTGGPERLVEILRAIIALSETKRTHNPNIESTNGVVIADTQELEIGSHKLFEPQGSDWINLQRAPRREIARRKGGDCEERGDADENDRIARIHSIKERTGESG